MSFDETRDQGKFSLRFYATAPRPCSYLEDRTAVSVFADPEADLSQSIYNQLALFGFRRSGKDLYVPSCPGCSQCIPVRVYAQKFKPGRSQKRIRKRNADLQWTVLPADFSEEHFELYSRYLASRHTGGGMENPTPEDYMHFLTSDWSDTAFIECRLHGKLAGVAVTDFLDDGLSAVYTFFDPDLEKRSPGMLSILQQLEFAREWGLMWLYLGYWISACNKMSYKDRFNPLQVFYEGHWQDLTAEHPLRNSQAC